uniref:Putative mitochondrial glycerol-3-phosphate acyltransferase gpat n=1 Tax=Corethrella appendiculata TaxID=1370023 RepID=U5EQV3_9DIPT
MLGIIEIFLFLCVVGYFYNKNRALDMVDILCKFPTFGIGDNGGGGGSVNDNLDNENGDLDDYDNGLTTEKLGYRMNGIPEFRRKALEREKIRQQREEKLYQIKEQPTENIKLPEKQIKLTCQHCNPINAVQQLNPNERRRQAVDMLRTTKHSGLRPNCSKFDYGVWCPHLAQCMRIKRHNFPQVAPQVIPDNRIQAAIKQAAEESLHEMQQDIGDNEEFDEELYYNQMWKKHEKRAKEILEGMKSKISNLVLGITSYVLYKLLPCFLSGVATHPAQIEMIRSATDNNPNVPLIFLPLHRSHLDYIMVSFILLNHDIRGPIVAGGDNLKIPFFGSVLRGDGAFFIKRKIDPLTGKKDIIYRAVLHTYLQKALMALHNVEFFIEGGRTRTGKPCLPKSGILSVIVDAYLDKSIEDALIVPVSVNYEKLVDGNFINEQLGKKKKPESFTAAASAIYKILKAKYGLMRIDFNEPFSLAELVNKFKQNSYSLQLQQELANNIESCRKLKHKPSTSSLYGTDCVQEEHRILVDNIARHVVYDCAVATSVMTTNALAFIFLTRYRDGATLSILSEALDKLRYLLDGERDIAFTGNSEDIIKYAVDLLGPSMIIKERRGHQLIYKPITMIPNVIELAYYSNMLIPHFALQSILVITATMLCRKIEREKNDFNNNDGQNNRNVTGVNKYRLLETCLEFCDILRYEFILCKPCQKLESMLENTFDDLCNREILTKPELQLTDEQQRAHGLAKHIHYEDDDEDEYNDYYSNQSDSTDDYNNRINNEEDLVYLPTDTHCDRIDLMSVLAPFSHTYTAVAYALNHLLRDSCIVENEFIKLCINEITERVDSGICKYGESISTDSIKNCLKLFEKRSIIEIKNNNGVRLIQLNCAHETTLGVQNIIQSIEKFVPV